MKKCALKLYFKPTKVLLLNFLSRDLMDESQQIIDNQIGQCNISLPAYTQDHAENICFRQKCQGPFNKRRIRSKISVLIKGKKDVLSYWYRIE